MPNHIYGDNAKRYLKNGFKPLPVKGKFPPVSGATGHDGVVDVDKVKGWRETHADQNLAIRAETWIGIDVDVYKDKHGDVTLANYEARLGPLPKAYSSTARGKKSPSRQYFFRVPDNAKLATKLGPDIEIIQYHHRYAMVEPSIHPELGTPYLWYAPNGKRADHIPHIDEFPDLPDAWLADLRAAPDSVLLDNEVIDWQEFVKTFPPAPACHISEAYRDKVNQLEAADHIGHDEALRLALEGFMLGREGHAGIGEAIEDLAGYFGAYLKKTRPREAKAELNSVLNSQASIAQRKLVEDECTCFTTTALTVIDGSLKKREAKMPPLVKKGTQIFYSENARDRFMADHPVKRYKGSVGATFIWLGDRWVVEDLEIICRRWLSARIHNDISQSKVMELRKAVMAAAEEITDASIDRRYISVANGLLNWETGELVKRSPELFVINHLPIAWRPSASLGKFAEWMETAVEPEMQPHVWEIIGYTVSPIHDLKVALAFSGGGGGGKSTLVNVLSNLVGEDNLSSIAPSAIGDRFNKVQLHGKLLNAVGDVGAETLRNIGALKSIIAGDAVHAEYKGVDGFSFRPNTFVVANFNALPATESNDSGFWDRWLVLAFKRRFADDKNAGDNYWRDVMPFNQHILEGILVEAVAALRRLRSRGQFDKRAFADAKNEWRREVDSVAAFASEKVVLDPDGLVKAKALHDLYTRVELGNGGHPRKNTTFYRELLAYFGEVAPGLVERVTTGANVLSLKGIKVLHNPDDTGLMMLDPAKTYGTEGYTSHPHLRLA